MVELKREVEGSQLDRSSRLISTGEENVPGFSSEVVLADAANAESGVTDCESVLLD